MPAIEGIGLFKDCAECIVTGVGNETEGKFGVWEDDKGGSGKGVDKSAKGRFLVGCPNEGYVLFGQGKQGSCDVGVILDEATIEVAKAKEGLQVLEFLRLWLFCNARDFGRVHSNFAVGYYDAKVVDGSLVEGAFLGFQVKVMFGETGEDIVS